MGWDLAVINDEQEHQLITRQINCARGGFWIGQQAYDGQMFDSNGSEVDFMKYWDHHSNIHYEETINMESDPLCIVIRNVFFFISENRIVGTTELQTKIVENLKKSKIGAM